MLATSSAQAQTFTSEIRKVTLSDRETSTTRLCLPQNREINTIVITDICLLSLVRFFGRLRNFFVIL